MSLIKRFVGVFVFLTAALFLLAGTVLAQDDGSPVDFADENPIPYVYTVQQGDNLIVIATNFGISVEAILEANYLAEEDLIYAGQELVIPGLAGDPNPTQYTVRAGDTLSSIATDFNTTPEAVASSNNIVNPYQGLVLGENLSLISRTGSAAAQQQRGETVVIGSGDMPLTIAAEANISPLELREINGLPWPPTLLHGQRVRIPGEDRYRQLPGEWSEIQINPLHPQQGDAVSIYVENLLDGAPSGTLDDRSLRFSESGDGYVAIIGFDAMADPGLKTLDLTGSGDRPWYPLRQDINLADAGFGTQYITVPEDLANLLDMDMRRAEDEALQPFYTSFTPEQHWQGVFQMPITDTLITATYGDGRSYNEGPVEIFHSGVDLGEAVGEPVLAPAPGNVVFSEFIDIRGNLVIIDHGLGVMSAFYHLDERSVDEGDWVETGDQIGTVGNTGLSSGPHLHWDVRVLDVPTDAITWTNRVYP